MPPSAGRPEQPLDMTQGPLARLAGELRLLRGSRTYRELAQQTSLSVGTLQAAAKGERLPSWRVAEAFAAACGGTAAIGTVRELWKDARAAEGKPVPNDPPDASPVPGPGSVTTPAQFIAMLNQLRAWAGTPSYAELNRRAPGYNLLPPATVSDVLRKQRLPRLEFVLAFVRACGLDDERAAAWEQAWAALREHELNPAGKPAAVLPALPPARATRAIARREAIRAVTRNFLVWLSGARPELLRHSGPDRVAYTGLGAAILTSGVIAAISMTYALQVALYMPLQYAVLIGTAWGMAITSVNRWEVFTIRRGTPFRILLTTLPRVMLALFFAIIITTPLLLRIFGPEIDAQVTVMRNTAATQASQAITRGPVGAQVALLQQQLDAAQTQGNYTYREWQCQVYGCGTTHAGNGELARAAQGQYLSATAQIGHLTTQLNQARTELTTLQDQSSSAIRGSDAGLIERLDALSRLTADNFTLAAARLLLALFFLVIDSLPIIIRVQQVSGPRDTYEKILEIQERADIHNASLYISKQRPAAPTATGKHLTGTQPQ